MSTSSLAGLSGRAYETGWGGMRLENQMEFKGSHSSTDPLLLPFWLSPLSLLSVAGIHKIYSRSYLKSLVPPW